MLCWPCLALSPWAHCTSQFHTCLFTGPLGPAALLLTPGSWAAEWEPEEPGGVEDAGGALTGHGDTHCSTQSGICTCSMGMSCSSSSKLCTYWILLMNLTLPRRDVVTRSPNNPIRGCPEHLRSNLPPHTQCQSPPSTPSGVDRARPGVSLARGEGSWP